MGHIRESAPVKYFIGITWNPEIDIKNIISTLENVFGSTDARSEIIDFSAFTDYYQGEMGDDLKKLWIGLYKLRSPDFLKEMKILTNELEYELSNTRERRKVNLDPGYITHANMIIATTKNYSHRIYIGNGIYGDLHYIYRNKRFEALDWTYPDYRQEKVMNFFVELRRIYLNQLKEEKSDANL